MGVKISLVEARDRIQEIHGNKISILEYSTFNTLGKFLCNICQATWITTPKSVYREKTGCPNCANLNRHKTTLEIQKVKEYIEGNNSGCILLSKVYTHNHKPLKILFSCGHKGSISLASFQRGRRCPKCGRDRSKVSRKITPDEMNKRFEENNLTFISFPDGYENINSRVIFSCKKGHINNKRLGDFFSKRTCTKCSLEKNADRRRHSNHPLWNGGLSLTRVNLKVILSDWRKESMLASGYKCVITGDNFDDIHHLYSFNQMMREVFKDMGLEYFKFIAEYTQEEYTEICHRLIEKHKQHPLGVCLRRDVHSLFHRMYGSNKNTPEQFYEFSDKIHSGEIKIS